jgi:hypothetical protein
MIAQLIAALLIGATKQNPTPPKFLDLKTFAQAMEPLAKAASYRIEGKPSILHSPVIVSLNAEAPPLERLKDLCTLLGLDTEINPDTKVIKVTVSSKGQPRLTESQRIVMTLQNLRDSMKVVRNMTPRQRYAESVRLQRMADAEQDRTRREQISERARMVASTAITREMVCISPLLFDDIGQLSLALGSPYRRGQDLAMSSDSMQLAQQVIQGNGTEVADLIDPNDPEAKSTSGTFSISQSFKKQASKVNLDNPIVHFMHVRSPDSIFLMCRAINPSEYQPIDIFSFPLVSGNPVIPDQTNYPDLTKRFKPESILNERIVELNSMGALASTLNMDYAGWLDWLPGTWFKSDEGTISEGLKNSLYRNCRFQEVRQAMTVRNYDRSIPPATEDWTPFMKVFHAMEKGRLTREEVLGMMDGFSESEFKSLDRISNEVAFPNSDYEAIMHGSVLLRIALKAMKPEQELFEVEFKDLTKESRSDILSYFANDYVWQNYPSYTHPLNSSLLVKSKLHVSIKVEGDHHLLSMKLTIPARPNRTAPQPIEFEMALK